MGPSQTVTVKYVIRAKFEIDGVVEKPDVIGAVFGQTEGLFGPELDLRELQKSGRIGRIEINLQSKQDKTTGTITIPTSLDRVSTAILAASIESINRVGPCNSKVTLEKVEDIRDARRKLIVDRAKEILHKWKIESMPSTEEVFREVSETLRTAKVEEYGKEKLTAGPGIENVKEIIVVEGRADVLNLLRCGILNVIALEGAKIPEAIIKLCKEKEATAFLDGDRGGDLILKELMQVTNAKYIARAPRGVEVEELNCKEIITALDRKVPMEPIKLRKERRRVLVPKQIVAVAKELEGTLEAVLLNKKMEKMESLPVSELAEKLQQTEDIDTVVFDGVITQRLVDVANQKKVKYLVAARISDVVKQPLNVHLITFSDIQG
ncbi:MAG: DNA primase DnaG [Candidatus Bathyarchaeota archaeon]|nr:DNA primase DnaG [Candidatus Bathyarchaeota archaeon]MDH5494106.1 DNA primase DnaG [Candidatus Bathyarchaeota archaeon]